MKFAIQISKGLIRDQKSRRMVMAVSVVIAAGLLFAGMTFLSSVLRENPFVFIGYWCVCGWFTMLSALLAIYDMLALRLRSREERRVLRARVLGRGGPDDSQ